MFFESLLSFTKNHYGPPKFFLFFFGPLLKKFAHHCSSVFSWNWKWTDSSTTRFEAFQTIRNRPGTYVIVQKSVISCVNVCID